MKKEQIITRIRERGLVAVVRAENEDKAFRIAEACLKGGVRHRNHLYGTGAHRVIEALSSGSARMKSFLVLELFLIPKQRA